MGLDAVVHCTCFQDGKASKPPIPRELIAFDEAGSPVPIWETLPRTETTETTTERLEASIAFMSWIETACEHEHMELVAERIGNVAAAGQLRRAASGLDQDRFPHLFPILSRIRGLMDETLPATEARAALPELEALLREPCLGTTRTLQELDGTIIEGDLDLWQPSDSGFVSLGPWSQYQSQYANLVELGIDGYEFVVRTRGEKPRELFRARMVTQTVHHSSDSTSAHSHKHTELYVTFRNVVTDERIKVRSFGVRASGKWPNGKLRDDEHGFLHYYPTNIIVGERRIMVTEFWWNLTQLHRLFSASDRTGNPVHWC